MNRSEYIRTPLYKANPKKVVNDVGQTAVEKVVVQEPAAKKSSKSKIKDAAKNITSPPPVGSADKKKSKSTLVKVLVLVAAAVIVLGLLFLILKLTLGLAVILIGVLPIIIIILAPLPSR